MYLKAVNMLDIVKSQIQDSIKAKQYLLESQTQIIQSGGLILAQSLADGNKILFCGNGGSAADAQHIAAELLIRYKSGNDRPALPALSLSSDASTVTACANDYGYEQLFSRQVEGLGKPGDVLVAITTSGNSPNIYKAIEIAHEKKIKIILLTGATGGKILESQKNIIDTAICVNAEETARIQECHILIGHIFCSIIEKKLYNMA